MNARSFRFLAPFAVLALFACATPFAPSAAKASLVVRQVGDGPATATVRVAPAGFRVQATAHSWVAGDIFEYRVALKVKDPNGLFVELIPPQTVTLAQKIATPATEAAFTGLKRGVYQAHVVAWGNQGGTAAALPLQAAPATVGLDLTTLNAVTGTATIQLDAVVLDATATALLTPPTDGTFASPSAAPTIEP